MPNEKSQIAVAAILKELGLPLQVGSKSDRLVMQKGIYLAQAAGANLSYWFNWYINGPYSPSLADDYYDAQGRLETLKKYSVSEGLQEKLRPIRQLIEARPKEAELDAWMEALASLDYMRRVQRKPTEGLVDACTKEKPHLNAVLPQAFEALGVAALLT